jgi:DNA (cytosine-5)-methyltransferase 1
MKFFDAFSGIGGFAIPLTELDHECVGFSEIDRFASAIYSFHFPSHQPYGDITKLEPATLPDFDLFVGGFPCQAFSISGQRRGFADTRGTLFFDVCRIAQAKQPRLVLLENVKGLLSHDGGRTFGTILASLDELGYDLQWQVLDSPCFSVPQHRERLFLLGHRRGTPRPQVFPLAGTSRPDDSASPRVIRWQNKKAGAVLGCIVPTLRASGGTDLRKAPVIVDPDGSLRFMTITEWERAQGFPDSWTAPVLYSQRKACLGNAVTVNVVREIVKRLTREVHEQAA